MINTVAGIVRMLNPSSIVGGSNDASAHSDQVMLNCQVIKNCNRRHSSCIQLANNTCETTLAQHHIFIPPFISSSWQRLLIVLLTLVSLSLAVPSSHTSIKRISIQPTRICQLGLRSSLLQCTKKSDERSTENKLIFEPKYNISTYDAIITVPSIVGYDTNTSVIKDPLAPRFFVVLSNLQSGSNIGSICRNALAFNACEVVVVGRGGYRDKMRQADRGAKNRLTFKHFDSTPLAAEYLKSQGCVILGIEILDSAVSVFSSNPTPFSSSTAFLFGNEGTGLSEKQRGICDKFVYIPQFASGGMASINVACASAIVFSTFAHWAGYTETARKGEKFQ